MRHKLCLILVVLIIAASASYQARAATNPVGNNIVHAGTVYAILYENGQITRRPYTSEAAFLSYKFNSWSNVVTANPDDLSLPIGSFIPPRDGRIICSDRGTDKGTCYLVTNNKKAGFTSENVFYDLGFTYTWASYGDVSFMQNAPHIGSGAEKHLPGTVLFWNDKIYLVTHAGLKLIPNTTILNSWGYWSEDTILANSSDWQFAINGELGLRSIVEFHPDLGEESNEDSQSDDNNLEIETSSLPSATAGQPYTKRLEATGGAGPYRWSTESTTYPSSCCVLGLSGGSDSQSDYYGTYDPVYFNTQSGSYVPYEYIGTYSWKIKVTDANGDSATKTLKLRIRE